MSAQLEKSITPAGGEAYETPFMRVVFQQGIPTDVGINGCRVQDVIALAMERLNAYQQGPLACQENSLAIENLHAAISVLNERIRSRQLQGVFNSMAPHFTHRTEDEQEDFSATGA